MFDTELIMASGATNVFTNKPSHGRTLGSLVRELDSTDWSAKHITVRSNTAGWASPLVALLQDPRCNVSCLRLDLTDTMIHMQQDDLRLLAKYLSKMCSSKVCELRLDGSTYDANVAPTLGVTALLDSALATGSKVTSLGVCCSAGMLSQLTKSLLKAAKRGGGGGGAAALRVLSLVGVKHEAEQFRELTVALQTCCGALSKLFIDLRAFDDSHAYSLAYNLIRSSSSTSSCSSLTELEIVNARRLGPVGGQHLANAVKHAAAASSSSSSCIITKLTLQGGSIGGKGARAFAEVLEHAECGLELLDLRHNELGEGGVRRLVRAMRHPNYRTGEVTLVALEGNEVDPASRVWQSFTNTQRDMTVARQILTLMRAREVKRAGTRSAVKRLPQEMFRLVAGMFE